MRFDPCRCPDCGALAHSTLEVVHGESLLTPSDGGSFEYDGKTEIFWNDQRSVLDASGRVQLRCAAGHQWPARRVDGSDSLAAALTPRLGRVCVPGYTVDLDDVAMVERARNALLDDLEAAAPRNCLADFVVSVTSEAFAEGSPASWLTDEEVP